jgi:SnoaL-like domain
MPTDSENTMTSPFDRSGSQVVAEPIEDAHVMNHDRARAAAFVGAYGEAWERWDVDSFVELFGPEVVYVAHPQETVVGRAALRRYLRKEETAQGAVSVRMGSPMLDGNRVMAEFWVAATNGGQQATIAGCLIAHLDPTDGLCTHFREYWFDLDGHAEPFWSWGA